MFEHKTFEVIINEMLARVPVDIDKREGSIIYDALAPTAMELAEAYSNMDLLMRLTFADTSSGEYLERRVGEHGVKRKKASKAIRRAIFTSSQDEPFDVVEGSRFRLGDIVYEVKERIEQGGYRVEAQTAGEVGNRDYGELIPVEPIDGLGTAILADVLIPGEDDESDESLYAKYLEHIREKAFGGNRADYKKNIMAIQGVGGVRLYRAPFGGGTVKAVIIDSNFNVPTPEHVELVQEAIDPIEYTGDGYGTAPIGHVVTIEAVEAVTVNLEATLTLAGITIGQVEPLVEQVFEDYLAEMRQDWNKELSLVVRITHIESRILQIEGVQDIEGTTLNGLSENLIFASEIPVKGSVTLYE